MKIFCIREIQLGRSFYEEFERFMIEAPNALGVWIVFEHISLHLSEQMRVVLVIALEGVNLGH
jgi:hypothetical protein